MPRPQIGPSNTHVPCKPHYIQQGFWVKDKSFNRKLKELKGPHPNRFWRIQKGTEHFTLPSHHSKIIKRRNLDRWLWWCGFNLGTKGKKNIHVDSWDWIDEEDLQTAGIMVCCLGNELHLAMKQLISFRQFPERFKSETKTPKQFEASMQRNIDRLEMELSLTELKQKNLARAKVRLELLCTETLSQEK